MPTDGAGTEVSTGTYVLAIELGRPRDINVGSLGTVHLKSGGYAYVGSAFGPGGFSRVERHHAVATGDHEVRHWHIDYLLADDAATLAESHRLPGQDRECVLARRLGKRMVDDFGASDCRCPSHLAYYPTSRTLQHAVNEAIRRDADRMERR
jgi:Uri superfamily endonuclease